MQAAAAAGTPACVLYHLCFYACLTSECNHMGDTTTLVLEQVAGLTLIFHISVVGSWLFLPVPLSMFLYLKNYLVQFVA